MKSVSLIFILMSLWVLKGIPTYGQSLYGQPCTPPMIHFELNSSEINPEYYPELYYLSQLMKSDPKLKIRVIGHAESTKNIQQESLSKERATNTVDFMVKVYGLDRNRFVIEYKGASETLIDSLENKPKLDYLQKVNSRVEFECIRD